MRGCIDLGSPNEHIVYEHFKMEGLRTIQHLLCCNDYITKVDLSDFYMHVLIVRADRRYMRFIWEGRKLQCIDMPFGSGPSACCSNDGNRDLISSIVRPFASN